MLIDIICYIALLALLFYMCRLNPGTKVIIKWDGKTLPGTILKCEPGLMNRVGLLNTPRLAPGDGLYLPGVKCIHTRGMHYPIDVIFLDEANRVLEFLNGTEPGQRKIRGPKGTRLTLELGAGTIALMMPTMALHQIIEVSHE